MAVEKLSLSTMNFYAPGFVVKIQNNKLPQMMSNSISAVSVEETMNAGATFSITVNDEFDMAAQEFTWLDHPLFNVGNIVEISIGYESNLLSLVKGNITSLEPSFFAGETPTITIRGQDLSYDFMKRRSPARTFANESYTEIASKIAREAGLTIDAGKTRKKKEPVCKQSNESYFSFLAKLAREVDFQVWLDGKTIYFKKPEDDKKEIMTLELGKDIISFRPNMNTAKLYGEVEVKGYDPRNPSRPIIGRAVAGSERLQESGRQTASQIAQTRHGRSKKVITDVVVRSVTHANSIARAVLNSASDRFIEGDVDCIGIPQIRPNACIRLEKMGKRFSGKYYVKSTTHTIDNSGYRTRFTVKRNAS